MKSNFEVIKAEADKAQDSVDGLIGGDFILDSKSDLEHDVYTGKCVGCGGEFSVSILKYKEEDEDDKKSHGKERESKKPEWRKEAEKELAGILEHKTCPNCRNK
jgi:hypothetical protein